MLASQYLEREPPIVHNVAIEKSDDEIDGTVWITEYYRGQMVFNYTLPQGPIYSWFVSYADVFTVAVPSYTQNFTLERTESGNYRVYVQEADVYVPVNLLGDYLNDETILDKAYPLFSLAVHDIRVRAKVHEKPFGICGVITKILSGPRSTRIIGFVINVEEELWAVVLDNESVMLIEEIIVGS